MKAVYSIHDLNSILEKEEMVVIYFSNDSCNVCKVLKPKITELLSTDYPKVELIYIDTEKSPVIAGQLRVFTIPTIDIYIQSKEHARFSRNITLFDFEKAISKPYSMLFSE